MAKAPTPDPKAAPIDMDALPPAGGSYTRQPDGTLVLNQPATADAPDAAPAPAATPTATTE